MAKLFPYLLVNDFLEPELNQEILDFAVEKESEFIATPISRGGMNVPDESICVSVTLYDMGRLQEKLDEKFRSMVPEMISHLKISPFTAGRIDLHLAAHGDGAFFSNHIDTIVHKDKETPRVISAIYYLHTSPKQFTGGELRLHPLPFGPDSDEPVDVAPDNNKLLVFPSFAPHEVLRINAPGVEFKNWRFALNCMIHKA